MMPLDIGDRLIDRNKASVLLNYLAKASYRETKRELKKRQLEAGLHRLKKLNTEELKKHVGHLEHGVAEVEERSRLIEQRQQSEEKSHVNIADRLDRLHKHLEQYKNKQVNFDKKIIEVEKDYDDKFAERKEKIKHLKNDLKRLKRAYDKVKASKKYSKQQLIAFGKRILKLKEKIDEI